MNKNILLTPKTADKVIRLQLGFRTKAEFLAARQAAWLKRETRRAGRAQSPKKDLRQRLLLHKSLAVKLNVMSSVAMLGGGGYYLDYRVPRFSDLVMEITLGSVYKVTSGCKKFGDHRSEFNFILIPAGYSSKCVQIIAGVVTVFAPDGRAYWLEASRGYSSKLVTGWVIEDDERQIHIASDKSRLACLVRFLKAKARKEKKLALINKFKNNFDVLRWVTVADSLRAGNCAEGTREFIERSGLTKLGAIRSDYLLELCNDSYTRTAIRFSTRFL